MAQLHVLMGADTIRARPTVRRIGLADLKDALARGLADFSAIPTEPGEAADCKSYDTLIDLPEQKPARPTPWWVSRWPAPAPIGACRRGWAAAKAMPSRP